MGKLTKEDIDLIQDKATQIDYGTIKIEFKNGECLAIAGEDRALTRKGKEILSKRRK